MICRGLRSGERTSFVEALFAGLDRASGLFLPVELPQLTPAQVEELLALEFAERAARVTVLLLGDELGPDACARIAHDAFDFPIPARPLDERLWILELFHGPTLAFKDFGARFMARAMAHARESRAREGPITILTATSGDTGSAVADAFHGAAGIEVVVLYPAGRVSPIQERQMATLGGNVHALSVAGSFDDCQRLVREAFQDQELRGRAGLTTANSMNLGRLVPQAFYYFEAVAAARRAHPGCEVVISVPSGNFGNLTAGVLAWNLGLPIARLVAATNANDTVPRFLAQGVYEPRATLPTLSTAMDVSIPNNWTRIEALLGNDPASIRERITAASVSDAETLAEIRDVEARTGIVLDPHSAVASFALRQVLASHPAARGVALATAHPAKFEDAIREALGHPVALPASLDRILSLPLRGRPLEARAGALRAFLLELSRP